MDGGEFSRGALVAIAAADVGGGLATTGVEGVAEFLHHGHEEDLPLRLVVQLHGGAARSFDRSFMHIYQNA